MDDGAEIAVTGHGVELREVWVLMVPGVERMVLGAI